MAWLEGVAPDLLQGWQRIALALSTLAIAWQITSLIYNLYFHPLREFPGPLLTRASGIPWAIKHVSGIQAHDTQKLHDKYGPVVRIGPSHLSFTDPQAWKDIYGHQVGSKINTVELAKAEAFSHTVRSTPTSILNTHREEHQRFRRALSHGFSDSSMRQQEPTISKYVDLLLKRLSEASEKGAKSINIEAWYNWTTFDVVGELVFGQSFGCLESVHYHPWVEFIFKAIRAGSTLIALTYLGFGWVVPIIVTIGAAALKRIEKYTSDMVSKRLEMERNDDLFDGLIKRREEWNLSFEKLSSTAFILVLAGSETTATTLSGATYLLLKHPEALEKLKQEVRSKFSSIDEITIASAGKLSYMLAVLNESLRLYPPVTAGLVRMTPPEGSMIAGQYVAGNTFVEVQHYSANHSKDNWADPWEFRPERFLEGSEMALEHGNRLDALQAFSVGPRNCIGRNLAYAEMRLILARLIYQFDITIADDSKGWIERQKAYTLWDRIPLNVYLTPVASASAL